MPSLRLLIFLLLTGLTATVSSAETPPIYFGHAPVEDAHGVIAPWYTGQNGQFDERVRIAAETLKRYPWTAPEKAPVAAPHYFYNGHWNITEAGEITIPDTNDWDNGDQGQRMGFVLSALVDYYRYTSDPAAIAHITIMADAYLKLSLTGPDHPWPSFPITVPVKGQPYGPANPVGYIQTDIAAEVGLALLKAFQVTGREEWFAAAKHWGDLFALYLGTGPDGSPWSRYANPKDVPWPDKMNGGVVTVISMLDELIRLGYLGESECIVEARDTARTWLKETLLPKWTAMDTWGRNYWDWECPVQDEETTTRVCRYFMANPDVFPNWRNDVRNITTLFIHHAAVATSSNADVYSGAWAYPESSGCCGRSLWYPPQEISTLFAEYGVHADSPWSREMARRQQLICTYDYRDTGYIEDNIDGGQIVAGTWFKITHPMSLKHILGTMSWMPDIEGASRENHIMRSSAVVKNVVYGDGAIRYITFDAPANTTEVLRLAFAPVTIMADGAPLAMRDDLTANGYMARPLPNGDCIVSVRHDGASEVVITGDDPQLETGPAGLRFEGAWTIAPDGALASANESNAAMTFTFTGNQVRLIGQAGPDGGLADVYLDGQKQLVGVDCWNPLLRMDQVLYYRSGLSNGSHELRITTRGEGNPISSGKTVWVKGVQTSDATGAFDYGSGGGPADTQRWVFGYTGREPLKDAKGNEWLTALEFITRSGDMTDPIAKSWWTEPRTPVVEGTEDQALYQYGAHWRRLTAYVTVAPGVYHARLRFAETRDIEAVKRAFNVTINGETRVKGFDIAATAGGLNKAVDLVFNNLEPKNGVIAVDLKAGPGGQAIIQALEVGPGDGGAGAEPVCVPADLFVTSNLLENGDFEESGITFQGKKDAVSLPGSWKIKVLSENTCYVWDESAYAAHPDWGLPKYHTGAQALRTHTQGAGHTQIWQSVEVSAGKTYEASAWLHAASLNGKGFGTVPGDSAGFIIEERDAKGQVIVTHPKCAVTQASDEYVAIKTTFTTTPETVSVRFILDTVMGSAYMDAHVTYDDCVLRVI